MKVTDVIFALVFGRIIGFLMSDFLREWDIHIGLYWSLLIWLVLPMVSLFCLYLASLIGRKLAFVFQGAKFFLVGAAATVFDLKMFEFLVWLLPFSVLAKSISFIFSTLLKYWGNKYWAFQKSRFYRGSSYEFSELNSSGHEKENIQKEVLQFFLITLVGLAIDVTTFYYFSKIMGSQFTIPPAIWIKLSVIFAALAAALWNFCGYKFLVFKK